MQQGGSQYGAPPPEIGPFSPSSGAGASRVLGVPGTEHQLAAEAASPISSRPPAAAAGRPGLNFDEFGLGAAAAAPQGGYPDDEALAAAAGEEAERGATGGNRWPRQETLALLKIRSDMDAAFRDATLKGPLWEDVSRKLGEMGYTRSSKKCKEKFENVHKYYKRTKDKSAGRPDGKSYRFFSQLEALHGAAAGAGSTAPTTTAAAAGVTTSYPSSTAAFLTGIAPPIQPTPISSIAPPPPVGSAPMGAGGSAEGEEFIFSSSASSSDSDTECDETEERLGLDMEGQRKRKRQSDGGGGRNKMMVFFKDLMNQVMDKQEAMQQRFLEAIEKREQDRMIREEAWRRQEMARLSREHEMAAQERAISASRDAAIVSFLQKITGQTVPLPQPITIAVVPPPQPAMAPPPTQNVAAAPPTPQPVAAAQPSHPAPPQQTPPPQAPPPLPLQPQRHRANSQKTTAETAQTSPLPSPMAQEQAQEPGSGADPASSRWPKSEVHALIKIRSEFEPRYQEAGPKGPLWEEISTAMKRLGYSRSSKRCKEKWENINKYFKKVKESNKKRPEDAKTCPYFHQLDALYRSKVLGGGSGNGGSTSQSKLEHEPNPNGGSPAAAATLQNFATQQPQAVEKERTKNGDGSNSSNGDLQPPNGKPEDTVKGMVEKRYRDQDSGNMEEDDDEDEDAIPYRIEFQQRPNGNGKSNSSGNNSAAAAAAANSFLAMVQ